MCTVLRCRSCWKSPVCAISCHSCDRRAVPPHLIRGKMQTGKGTESTKKVGFAFLDDIHLQPQTHHPTTGVCPDGVVDLGPEVWSPSGAKMLGTLVGSHEFVGKERRRMQVVARGRYSSNAEFRDATLLVHNATQCIPGSCAGHDEGMMSTMDNVLGQRNSPTSWPRCP